MEVIQKNKGSVLQKKMQLGLRRILFLTSKTALIFLNKEDHQKVMKTAQIGVKEENWPNLYKKPI